jgi:hypothetical protein
MTQSGHRGRKLLHFMLVHRSLSLAAGKVISKIDPYLHRLSIPSIAEEVCREFKKDLTLLAEI